MNEEELKGKNLRGLLIFKIIAQDLETLILDVKTESKDSFKLVKIETSRGTVECKYYRAAKADKGIIMVGGSGGFIPADNLYPRMGESLIGEGISSLCIKFRNSIDMAESIIDVLVGIEFLKSKNIKKFGLIGFSFGGSVVVQVAFNEHDVKTVVLISTIDSGLAPISFLPKETSILILHGKDDRAIPPEASIKAYEKAHEPKRLKTYIAGHSLNEVVDEAYKEIRIWILQYLQNSKSVL